jgi:hypothetical protein
LCSSSDNLSSDFRNATAPILGSPAQQPVKLLEPQHERKENALVGLSDVRDRSPFSSRNTSKGALVEEIFGVFQAVRKGLPLENVRKSILDGAILRKSSFETRRKIMNAVSHRYFWPQSEWTVRNLAEATEAGVRSPAFVSLAYLYYALRDRLTFEFIVGPVWERWRNRSTSLSSAEFLAFLEEQSINEPLIKKWRESTRNKLASNALTALREFGLLHGIYSKQIQKPATSPETTFHLLCVLLAEGQEGRSVVEARDWRLFLWSESEVAHALGELSQKRWIRFEKSGRTVMLELVRRPEVTE